MDGEQLLTGALAATGVSMLAAIRPVFQAWMRALTRKADQLYQQAPSDLSREQRRQHVKKELGRSMIGAPMPAARRDAIVEDRDREEERPTQELP